MWYIRMIGEKPGIWVALWAMDYTNEKVLWPNWEQWWFDVEYAQTVWYEKYRVVSVDGGLTLESKIHYIERTDKCQALSLYGLGEDGKGILLFNPDSRDQSQ